MDPRLIHPEDRRRDGGSDVGRGYGDDDGDAVPAHYRSEAFAEDLSSGDRQLVPPRRECRAATLTASRPRPARKPLPGLGWIAAFGLRGAVRD